MGKIEGYKLLNNINCRVLPYVGYITILLNDYP